MATISFARGAPSLDIVDVEGLREAAQLAFDTDPAGTTAYGTSVGYVPLREWIAEQHGVGRRAGARHQRLDAGRRVPVRADGAARRRGDRRVADLRPHAAEPAQPRRRRADGRARARRHQHRRRWRRCSRGRHPKLAHIIPNFQNPAGYTLSRGEAQAAAGARGRARLHDLRGRPVRRDPLRGRARSRRCSRRTTAGRVVYASSFSKTVCPGIRVGYLVGPQAIIKQIQTLGTNTYISPNMVAQSIVNQFARSRAHGRRDRDGQERAARPPRRGRQRAPARAARGEVRAPRGRLLHVGRAARGGRRGRAREGRGPARRAVRQGHGLPARGRPQHAAPGLLRRDARADRRGHHEAGRGRSVPWRQRHSYGDDPSQYGVLYGEGPVAVAHPRRLLEGRVRPDADGRALRGPRGARLGGVEHRVPAARQRRRRAGHARRRQPPRSTTWPTLRRRPLARRRDRPLRGRPSRGLGGDARRSRGSRSRTSSRRPACSTSQRARELRLSDGVVDRFLGDAAARASPRRSSACRSACPTLLTHGALDDIVPVEISAALRARLAARRCSSSPTRATSATSIPSNPLWKAVLAWL